MRDKIVVFTGAGVSAESGIRTFRDMGGLWNEYALEDVASPEGWRRDAAAVLRFYNERRRAVLRAEPNAAHRAIARLEQAFEVQVITQNVDDLHERGGSSRVIHVHGEIMKARSSIDPALVYPMHKPDIEIGDLCERGSQLRPHIVWFGEDVLRLEACAVHFAEASRILTVGTSLSVFPAAGLVDEARNASEKYLVSPDRQAIPRGYRWWQGLATTVVPDIVNAWLEGRRPA